MITLVCSDCANIWLAPAHPPLPACPVCNSKNTYWAKAQRVTMDHKKRQAPEGFHPGEIIKEELEARGWTVSDLALKTGLKEYRINEIINKKANITSLVADALGSAFGTSSAVWTNLQKAYDVNGKE